MFPPDEKDEATNVSNENNFSAYAGLKFLRFFLMNNTIPGSSDPDIDYALEVCNTIISGLEKFFKKSMSPPGELKEGGGDLRVFYQGGHVPFNGDYEPVELRPENLQAFAVDCQTWAVGALGVEWIDHEFGDGTVYRMWKATKLIGGSYDDDDKLRGVGYTNHTARFVERKNDVWSAEWTWGAINMVRMAAKHYSDGNDADHKAWTTELLEDMHLMRTALKMKFSEGGMINDDDNGYMYANVRFFIPWGWYANPFSSLCSTSWAIFDEFDFNPFRLGGGVF